MLGAICAVGAFKPFEGWVKRYLLPLCALLLILIPVLPLKYSHPGVAAIFISLVTALLLVGRMRSLDCAVLWPLHRLGDWSYSLYLIHWPLFAFSAIVFIGNVPLWLSIFLILLSVALASCQYHYVEQMFRRDKIGGKYFYPGLAALTAGLAIPAIVHLTSPINDQFKNRRNVGLNEGCRYIGDFQALPDCRTGEAPKVIVWGDSYAMHLLPGIRDTFEVPVEQATKAQCSPILGVAFQGQVTAPTRSAADNCLKFNRDVLKHIGDSEELEIVIISSVWSGFFRDDVLLATPKGSEPFDVDRLVGAAAETLHQLRRAGKRVVLVGPTPVEGFDVGACLRRQEQGLLVLREGGCTIFDSANKQRNAARSEFLGRLSRELYLPIISIEEFLCDGTYCRTSIEGTHMYLDGGHLTPEGSTLFATSIDLEAEIYRLAN